MELNIKFVQDCIEKYRKKLLDTSKRNNLISFKHSESSRQYIRVIDELPDILYKHFVDGKTLTFESLPEEENLPLDESSEEFKTLLEQGKLTDEEYIDAIEEIDGDDENSIDEIKKVERILRNKIRAQLGLTPLENQKRPSNIEVAKKHGINPSYEMPFPSGSPEDADGKHTDKFIQTLLRPEEMARTLSGLVSYIKTDTDETGVNTLYVAFGFLNWFEAENSNKPCTSPLFLLQLEIKKELSKKGYVFRVQSTGEKPEINLSLGERLKLDFGMELPDFEDEDSPERYLQKVSEVIKGATGIPKRDAWRIKRYITIGRFRFSQLVMFHDLNPERWPINTSISSNPVIQKLFSGEMSSDSQVYAEDYNVDTEVVENTVPLLITSADASQHSAIVDVMNGKNLAIKGPPGTGKSQTITNIIANALAKGKKVLFLAEKMAALNVVHERLNKAKLGPFCLELHSTKAQKTKILKSIEERISHTAPQLTSDIAAKVKEYKKHRDHLSEYINILNSRFGIQNKTVHDYLWGTQLRRDKLETLPVAVKQLRLSFIQANLSETELSSHLEDINLFIGLKGEIDIDCNGVTHPWAFVLNLNLNPFQQEDFRDNIKLFKEQIDDVYLSLREFLSNHKLELTWTKQGLREFENDTQIISALDVTEVDSKILSNIKSHADLEEFLKFINAAKRYNQIVSELEAMSITEVSQEMLQELDVLVSQCNSLHISQKSISEIQSAIAELTDIKLFLEQSTPLLDEAGKYFGISKDDTIEKIVDFSEIPEVISSVPREYLVYRSKDIIDENNSAILQCARESQKEVQSTLSKLESRIDISLLGEPHEIRLHAAVIENSNFFSFLDPSFRKAKKTLKLAHKIRFQYNKEDSVAELRTIASLKDTLKKIENDAHLRSVCGNNFKGIDTDFEKLFTVNNWASNIRSRFGGTKEISRSIRNFLLSGDIEELDSLRQLHSNTDFKEFKSQIVQIKKKLPSSATLQAYIVELSGEITSLTNICSSLLRFTSDRNIPISAISHDLSCCQKIYDINQEIHSFTRIAPILEEGYQHQNTDISKYDAEFVFFTEFTRSKYLSKLFPEFFNEKFKEIWSAFISKRDEISSKLTSLEQTSNKIEEFGMLNFAPVHDDWRHVNFEIISKAIERSLADPTSLVRWIKYSGHLRKLQTDIKGELIQTYIQNDLEVNSLPTAFEWLVFNAISREIYNTYPTIKDFNGQNLAQARSRLKELDNEIVTLQQINLNRDLTTTKPLPGNSSGSRKTWTEGALIFNEINKQKQHVATRDLLTRAGKSIQLIKPCFMMSPMTVAQYLPPGKFEFDLIVIDEASQMCPEDALGGIARAKQIVVVGDPEQLPPTNFFKQNSKEDDEEFEDFNSDAIMDLALSSFRPAKILSRHYRSQHESLIEFSNYHFYERNLILFPSPIKNPEELGVRLEYVGGTYSSSSNLDEVKAITKAALDFMRRYPERSLGIATMNQVQSELIEAEMDKAFVENPHAVQYKTKWQDTLEYFFVKNLESVQGDERDAIFISTVFGPDKNGVIAQNFGPINWPVGYRRLNVLFTRAKKNMWVFTSLKPEDIKTSKTSSKGLLAFKGFLAYADNRVLDSGHQVSEEADSDFEIWVKEKLESIGCEVHTQVGVAGYRIDLGVKHPKYPYGYLLGVECDGASYHSSKSARERDIIRQQILENLGWKIYRIWSTDWFSQPQQEFERLKQFIGQQIADATKVPIVEQSESLYNG